MKGSLTSKQLALSPAVGLANGLLNLLLIILASRSGQLGDIAGFTIGASAVSLVAVVASGGTTLTYVNGSPAERRAVRRFRRLCTTPILLIASGVAALMYQDIADIRFTPVLLGGLAVSLNNATELSSADLQRAERVSVWAVAVVLSRGVAVVVLVLGVSYAWSMLFASAVLYGMTRRSTRATHGWRARCAPAAGLWTVYSVRLLALSVSNILLLRAPFLTIPFVADDATTGAVTVLLTTQQSVAAIFTTGLYAAMAVRSRVSGSADAVRIPAFERLLLLGAVLASVVALSLGGVLLDVLNLDTDADLAWWYLMVLAIPVIVVNRRWQYLFLGQRKDGRAASMVGVALTGATVMIISALILDSVGILVASVLVGEMLALPFGLFHHARRRG